VDRRPCIEAKMGGTGDRRVADLHGSAVHCLEGRCGVPQVAMQVRRRGAARPTPPRRPFPAGGEGAQTCWRPGPGPPGVPRQRVRRTRSFRTRALTSCAIQVGRAGQGNGGIGSAPTPRQIPLVRIFMLERRSANTPSKVRHHTTS
jgi:hypothetical protein